MVLKDLILVVSGPVVLGDLTPAGLRSDDFDILESGGPQKNRLRSQTLQWSHPISQLLP